jgi:23S rRNA (pseudouridine1915-N3)-methyltransferase
MKIELWQLGKNHAEIEPLITLYDRRIKQYNPFSIETLQEAKKIPDSQKEKIKQLEGATILKKLDSTDLLILLDEKGKNYTSVQYANQLQQWFNTGKKRMIFLIGGAYGFDDSIYKRQQAQISFSSMTFSHQIIRVMFMEQLYRAFTILNNEPYHHE